MKFKLLKYNIELDFFLLYCCVGGFGGFISIKVNTLFKGDSFVGMI